MNQDEYLLQYNFPPELDIKLIRIGSTIRCIEFTLPVNLQNCIKDQLYKQDFVQNTNIIICSKRAANKVYQIKGSSFEKKIKVLLFILKNVKVNDKPVFEAEFIPEWNMFKYAHLLSQNITPNLNREEIEDIIKKEFNIDNKPCHQVRIDRGQLELTTEETYILLSILSSNQGISIEDLIKDENQKEKCFHLMFPQEIDVSVKYGGFGRYIMEFPNCSENLINQIKNQVLPAIKSNECIFATFARTDPIDPSEVMRIFNDPNLPFVVIPDENDLLFEKNNPEFESYRTTYIEIFPQNIDDETVSNIKSNLEEIYRGVELAVCRKCQMLFCPSKTEERCIEYYHKGKQIPFESGQMEEVAYDEEIDDEPYIVVNYTCCGENPKDEAPFDCGKRENGFHEIDEKEGFISKLTIERRSILI